MKKIMMIGYGAMAKEVIARLPEGVEVGWILARAAHHAAIAEAFGGRVLALTHPEQCLQRPDLVLECASQQAVAEFGEAVLQRGFDPLGRVGLNLVQCVLADARRGFLRREIDHRLEIEAAIVGFLVAWVYPAQRFMAAWRGGFLQFAVIGQEARILRRLGDFGRTARQQQARCQNRHGNAQALFLHMVSYDEW